MADLAIDHARLSRASAHGIGVQGLVVFYVTSLVGAGILIVPGIAARRAGPASLVVWAVLGLASFPIAMMFAEMSARRPNCGGIAALVHDVFGARAGDTASLALVVAYVVLEPVLAIASARHLCDLLGLDAGFVMPLAAGFIVLSGAFCLASVATAARLQGMVLIALLACLLAAVLLAVPSMSTSRLRPFAPHGWAAVGAAVTAVFFCFLGWENVSTIAEEVCDPRRSFHRAIWIAAPIVAILYLSVTAGFLAVPSTGSTLVMPTTNAWMLGASRLVLSTARDGILPARLQSRSTGTDAPVLALSALVVACVLVIGVLALIDLDERFAIALPVAIFLALSIAAALATLRDGRPTPITRFSAIATGLIAVGLLPFTGWALPVAALILLATHTCARVTRRQGSGRQAEHGNSRERPAVRLMHHG